MPSPLPTEIRIAEDGDEFHESWLLMRFSNITSTPGAKLFDSEVRHTHYVQLTVTRCTRKRDLHHDWLHNTQTIIEIDMSLAQFGALVSSFGNGSGVPATLSFLQGIGAVPGVATQDSRLGKSHAEVRDAGSKAMEGVRKAQEAVNAAFERGAGKREMRGLLNTLQIRIDQLPGNMEFAAKSLTEHSENVSQKLRADLEAMVVNAQRHGMELDAASLPALTTE